MKPLGAEKPFAERLHDRVRTLDSRVCLGIDPRPELHASTDPRRFGGDLERTARAVASYFQRVVEATHGLVACYKLQSAFFEALGLPGMTILAEMLGQMRSERLPVILDGKRGDIGSTAEAYAAAYLGQGDFAADALTVNPFLGFDSLEPFAAAAQREGRGLFVLVRTSNPGSRDVQDLPTTDGSRVHEHLAAGLATMAERLRGDARYGPLGAVAGATFPRELAGLRQLLPHAILLVPGYGAQGGAARDVVHAFDEAGLGAVISSSRDLTYFGPQEDPAARSRTAARDMRDAINRALDKSRERAPAS